MKKVNIIYTLIILALMSCTYDKESKKDLDIEKEINAIVRRMTLEEKIGQMQQLTLHEGKVTEEIKNMIRKGLVGSFLNVPSLKIRNELQKIAVEESKNKIPLIFGRDVIHGYKTVFPIPIGMASSWNVELVEKAARIAALEARSNGIDWTFAPMMDISRDPRWGRIAESFGEDPYLASCMARAMTYGFQKRPDEETYIIAACAKHYVGYGAAEGGKDYNTTLIPETELRNIYLPPFKEFVNAGGLTIMSAFNDLNGIPASGNEFTLRKILRKEWNFKGFVVSDWASMVEMINHGYCKDTMEVAKKAIIAGVDMEMVSDAYAKKLAELVRKGIIKEKLIDESVKNILRVKYKLGLFAKPYIEEGSDTIILNKNHLEIAKKLAIESCVLLKNSNNILPLSRNLRKIALIGPLADSPRDQLGTWTPDGDPKDAITPLNAIINFLGNDKVLYEKVLINSRDKDKKNFNKALNIANQSDVIVAFLGEEEILSGESHSRAFIRLPGAQEDLIKELAKTRKPIIGVIMAGRPLVFSNIEPYMDAILYAWHPGTMGGPAIVDLIFGNEVPSGKLTVSFPRTEGQIPVYYNHKNTGRPPKDKCMGIPEGDPQNPIDYVSYYLDLDYRPAYPFGYGLTYSTLEYKNLQLSKDTINEDENLNITVEISNTGKYIAHEIVQLYIRDPYASLTRPVKELKKFKKITIKPGETIKVNFQINKDDLKFYNIKGEHVLEEGDFKIFVGTNSVDVLEKNFYLVIKRKSKK